MTLAYKRYAPTEAITIRVKVFGVEPAVAGGAHSLLRSRAAVAPEIAQDFARRIMAGRAGDAAARMGSGAAQIEARERAAVITVAKHGTRREELIQLEPAMHDVAADEPENALQIERREDLPPQHGAL